MKQFPTKRMGNRDLLGIFMAAVVAGACGCTTLSTQSMPLEVGEPIAGPLVQSQYGPDSQMVDAEGNLVTVPPRQNQPGREKAMISLPQYRVEPPDILLINAVRLAPKSPYFVRTLDILQIVVLGTLPDQPIAGPFQVEPNGMVNLGPAYGSVKVTGLSIEEITDEITKQLRKVLQAPEVSVSLLEVTGQQQIAGEHLVGPDGSVNLGTYGTVYVAGMTLDEAREAIERHLSQFLDEPEVAVDVFAYNSKVYYVLTEGAGFGDNLVRVPITGNETVLDAIAQIGGLSQASSTSIWISRPAPSGVGCDQILAVDWNAITKGGSTATNYQILPGDRVYIAEDRLVAFDSLVSRITSPFERMFGFTLLGAQTVQTINRFPRGFRTF